jgi:hypothetical protein
VKIGPRGKTAFICQRPQKRHRRHPGRLLRHPTKRESMDTQIPHQTEWDYLHQRRHNVRLRALMNRLYQQRRAAIMEMREGAVKAASLIAGSVALANVSSPVVVQWAAAVIFLGTACSLVFSWGNKARDAARRASDWVNLDRAVAAAGERSFTEDQLDEWMARCNEIEANEPASNDRLLERCYKEACATLGSEPAPSTIPAPWLPAVIIP